MHKLCVKCNKKCVYCGLPKAEWYGPECSEAPHVEVPVSSDVLDPSDLHPDE